MPSLTIAGIQAVQQDNIRAIAAMKPGSHFGALIKSVTAELQRYSVSITHVDTGALKASERIEFNASALRGRIYIDESSRRPGGGKPAEYGVTENARGGSHAFFDRTINERLDPAFDGAATRFVRSF